MSPLDQLEILSGPERERARRQLLLQLADEITYSTGGQVDPAIDDHIALLSGDKREQAEQLRAAIVYAVQLADGCAPERDRETSLAILGMHRALRRLIFRIKPH